MPVVRKDGRAGGRSVSVRSRDYQMFSEGRLPHFLSYGAARVERRSTLKKVINSERFLCACILGKDRDRFLILSVLST